MFLYHDMSCMNICNELFFSFLSSLYSLFPPPSPHLSPHHFLPLLLLPLPPCPRQSCSKSRGRGNHGHAEMSTWWILRLDEDRLQTTLCLYFS